MHARTAPKPVLPRIAARLVLVLALAPVLAQALGLMHRVTHFAPAGQPAAMHQAQPGEAKHWVAALFAGHASDTDCRLYDPLNHDGPPSVPALVLPLALTSFFLAIARGDHVARWAALFDARGPPVSR
ncbi:hypothetical protein HK414_10335 [Ramlibacter terrae]|uniref:DUF2946 domain-containing protein n=1 Tax=Ramlibacter terrae TaxID=2732511 RepID=A0ABX6P3H8_9BURK|nr:hypothetical protein HK414_10335 [Ramlibacter terrae]